MNLNCETPNSTFSKTSSSTTAKNKYTVKHHTQTLKNEAIKVKVDKICLAGCLFCSGSGRRWWGTGWWEEQVGGIVWCQVCLFVYLFGNVVALQNETLLEWCRCCCFCCCCGGGGGCGCGCFQVFSTHPRGFLADEASLRWMEQNMLGWKGFPNSMCHSMGANQQLWNLLTGVQRWHSLQYVLTCRAWTLNVT